MVLADGLPCADSQFGAPYCLHGSGACPAHALFSDALLEGLCYVSQGTVFSAAFRGSQRLPSLCHFYEMIKLGKWKGKKNGSRSVCWAQGMSLKAGKRERGRTCRQWGERREGYTQRKPARSGPFSDATACFIHSKTVIHGHP